MNQDQARADPHWPRLEITIITANAHKIIMRLTDALFSLIRYVTLLGFAYINAFDATLQHAFIVVLLCS